MASVYHMSEAQLNAWLATRIPRNPSRSGGLIVGPECQPISRGRNINWHVDGGFRKKRLGRKRRTFRDN